MTFNSAPGTISLAMGRLAQWCLAPGLALVLGAPATAEAAVSKGTDKQLEAGATNQGGGTTSASQFRQQGSVGEPTAGVRIASARFRIFPGFLGASLSGASTTLVSQIDIIALDAKTEPLGLAITPKTWQADHDPIFLWEPPPTGAEVAGYSYALDSAPDAVVDTTSTSFDVATASPNQLADGVRTFTVQAINTAGNAGKPLSLELWVDTTPPQIVTYTPSPAALVNAAAAVRATLSDAASGVNQTTASLLVNGSAAALSYDAATGVLTATGGAWKEGANSLELRVADAVGNAQTPLVWSVTLDTKPPTGTVTINAGAAMTTSVHVTLGLNASDATSGLSSMLISNDLLTGYVQEPYTAIRKLWKLTPIRGLRDVYVKFVDAAGNTSGPVSDAIDLVLLSPETVIISGPAGFTQNQTPTFTFRCPEGDCLFARAFDNDEWSEWGPSTSATKAGLVFGNHYFRVKAAKDLNGTAGIQPDEEDPSPAERTWIVGVEPSILTVPKGPHIKMWRLE